MDEPGDGARRAETGKAAARSGADRGPADGGDTIRFGGLPFRWPFPEASLLGRVPTYLAGHVGAARRAVVMATLIALIGGLVIGFGVGHFTARTSPKAAAPPTDSGDAHSQPLAPLFVSAGIQATGRQCAAQVGKNLLLGIEIVNASNFSIRVDRIIPKFPLGGGLRTIAAGVGACGELPAGVIPVTSLSPKGAEWINATVAVLVKCPQGFPVWFKVKYTMAGKSQAIVIPGFSDLAQVSYQNCPTIRLDLRFSASSADAVETP